MPSLPPPPAPATGFIPRPESGRAAAAALVPGATVVLVPDRGGVHALAPAPSDHVSPPGREWADSRGKTQLAIWLATSLRESGAVDLVIWVPATSRASVLSAYLEAAAALDLLPPDGTRPDAPHRASQDAEAVASRLLSWLHETTRPWLVVLDDLTETAVLDRLWPAGRAGRVLVTTASAAAPPVPVPVPPGGYATIPVGTFTRRESASYVMGRLTEDMDQRQGVADLATELGDEPLALAQASSAIAASELTCRGYLNLFTDRRDQLREPAPGEAAPPSPTARHAGGLSASPSALTWALSVEQADVLAGDIAHAQLTFAALLDGNGTPLPVFTAAGRLHSVPDAALHEGLSALEAAGLLSIDAATDPALVRVNQAVQAATRAATSGEAITAVASAVAAGLLASWPEGDRPEWLARAYRSCTDRLRRIAGDTLWADGCHGLLIRAGQSLEAMPAAGAAARYWNELAVVSERVLGAEHPGTLALTERMARAYLASGEPAEAIPWFQWVRKDRLSRLGPDAPASADASRELGEALLAAGRAAEAVPVLTETVASYDHALGLDSSQSMGTRDDLITALRLTGQLMEAIWLGKRTLADRERVQGDRHLDTLTTAARLAAAYLADAQVKPAISLLRRVVGDREKAFGPLDLDTVAARASLAGAYYGCGKMASAVQQYERVRAEYTVVLGGEHRLALSASLNLAHALYGVGRQTDATKLLRETAERCEQHLPPGDPLTATATDSLRNLSGAVRSADDGAGDESISPVTPAALPPDESPPKSAPRSALTRRLTARYRAPR